MSEGTALKESLVTALQVSTRIPFLAAAGTSTAAYEALLSLGERYTTAWDEPVLTKNF